MSEVEPFYPLIPDPGYRFFNDLGSGFTIGLAGSSIVSLFGSLHRGSDGLTGATRVVSASAPCAAGTLAAYFAPCSAVSALETTVGLARPNKEDLWNALAAGAVSWAAVGVRWGAADATHVAVSLANKFFDGCFPL